MAVDGNGNVSSDYFKILVKIGQVGYKNKALFEKTVKKIVYDMPINPEDKSIAFYLAEHKSKLSRDRGGKT